jgi:hypothetical protein
MMSTRNRNRHPEERALARVSKDGRGRMWRSFGTPRFARLLRMTKGVFDGVA